MYTRSLNADTCECNDFVGRDLNITKESLEYPVGDHGHSQIDGDLDVSGDVHVQGNITADGEIRSDTAVYASLTNDTGFIDSGGTAIALMAGGDVVQLTSLIESKLTAGQYKGQNGSESAPLYSFNADPDTGGFLAGSDTYGISAGGTEIVSFNSSGLILHTGRIQGTGGNEMAPAYSFVNDPDTGVYNSGTNILDFSAGGTRTVHIDSNGLTVDNGQMIAPDGTAASPSYTFTSNPDTGIFHAVGNANMCFATDGITRACINNARLDLFVPTRGDDGSSSTPTYSFSNSTNTGLRSSGVGLLDLVADGADTQTLHQNYTQFNKGVSYNVLSSSTQDLQMVVGHTIGVNSYAAGLVPKIYLPEPTENGYEVKVRFSGKAGTLLPALASGHTVDGGVSFAVALGQCVYLFYNSGDWVIISTY